MGIWKAFETFARDVKKAQDRPAGPSVRPKGTYRLPGGARSDSERTTRPMTLNALVRSSRADVAGGIWAGLRNGLGQVRIGIGDDVHICLLKDDLLSAHVQKWPDDICIASVRWGPKGYVIERGRRSFGVFCAPKAYPGDWMSIRNESTLEGLRPGDLVSLGSCPGEGITFRLPVPPDGCATTNEVEEGSWRIERRLRTALQHWRYAELTLGTDPESTIPIDDPTLGSVKLLFSRDPDEPRNGLHLEALEVGEFGVRHTGLTGHRFHPLSPGDRTSFERPGHRLKIGPYEVVVPGPVNPSPRFADRTVPSLQDILEVFELDASALSEPDRIKARYRELARRFHPDRTRGDPGHASRFVEIRACWAEWEARMRRVSRE